MSTARFEIEMFAVLPPPRVTNGGSGVSTWMIIGPSAVTIFVSDPPTSDKNEPVSGVPPSSEKLRQSSPPRQSEKTIWLRMSSDADATMSYGDPEGELAP